MKSREIEQEPPGLARPPQSAASPATGPAGQDLTPAYGLLRLATYAWAAPNSLLGVALALFGRLGGGSLGRVEGVLEAEGPAIAWVLSRLAPPAGGAEALTLGHVVLGRTPACLERCRRHERVHVRQYETWGPLFLPAYFLSSLMQWVAGRDPYRDNRFEREAFAVAPLDDRAASTGSSEH